MNCTSSLPTEIVSFLNSQTNLADIIFTVAYENDIKPTPLQKAIVAISVEKSTIGSRKTVVADDGLSSLTNDRDTSVKIKVGFYVPYSKGANGCYELFDKVMTALLFTYDKNISQAECYDVSYVRDTGGLVLESYFTVTKVVNS